MSAETPLTADAALAQLRQYGERAKTWSTATYDSGTERALHQIATTLAAEVERLAVMYRVVSEREHDLINERDELRHELAARLTRADVLREYADKATPAPPEVSFFGDHGVEVGAWLRKQAEYAEATEPGKVTGGGITRDPSDTELRLLRGLLGQLRTIAQHGGMDDLRAALAEHDADMADAAEAGEGEHRRDSEAERLRQEVADLRGLLAAMYAALDLPWPVRTEAARLEHERTEGGRQALVELALARVVVADRAPADETADLTAAVADRPVTYPARSFGSPASEAGDPR